MDPCDKHRDDRAHQPAANLTANSRVSGYLDKPRSRMFNETVLFNIGDFILEACMIVFRIMRHWMIFLAAIGLTAGVAAQDRVSLAGSWYGEISHQGTYAGIPYDRRRWVTVRTQDGTGQTTMRFYSGSQFETETVASFQWGVQNDIYWERCLGVRDDNGLRDCSGGAREDYTIRSLGDREFRYTSQSSGRNYLMQRVPRDFTLPK